MMGMFNEKELEQMAKAIVMVVCLGCVVAVLGEIRALIWIWSTF